MSASAVRFNDRWFTGQKRGVLAQAVAVAPRRGAVCEIGCWEGQSSVWLANAFDPRILHCFDWWKGSPNDFTYGLAAQRDVHGLFVQNMEAGTSRNYEEHYGDWRETLPRWLRYGRRVAFAYIDATHTYDEVADCISLLRRSLTAGAVLAGDDYRLYPEVAQAVRDTLGPRHVAPPNGHGVWYWMSDVRA